MISQTYHREPLPSMAHTLPPKPTAGPVNVAWVPPPSLPTKPVNKPWAQPNPTGNTSTLKPNPTEDSLRGNGDVLPSLIAPLSHAKSDSSKPVRIEFIPASSSIPQTSNAMRPLPNVGPSSTSLGKRKATKEDDEDIGNYQEETEEDHDEGDGEVDMEEEERESSSLLDIKTAGSSTIARKSDSSLIPILPMPLPSKRFKKHAKSKATLIPAEQLPTYPVPPLPQIKNPELAKQVFTHQSLFEKGKGRFEEPEDQPAQHYEKLEHVGDSILGMLVTTWLHEIKPNLTCGAATKLKAHLVSNATLSHLSGLYNLPQRLNGDPELLLVLRNSTDIRAAMMEAYIAAIYFSYSAGERITVALPIIDSWLREMYEPLFDFFYEYMRNEYEQHRLACAAGIDGTVLLLSEEEMSKIDQQAQGMTNLVVICTKKQDRYLKWDMEKYETNIGVLWKVVCVVDGMELGEATRSDKKKAKNVAAWEAAKKLGLVPE